MAETPPSLHRGPRFDPWLGNWIPHAATKSLHATVKDPKCCSEDLAQPNTEVNKKKEDVYG